MVKTNKQRYLEEKKRKQKIAKEAKKLKKNPFDLKRFRDEQNS